ncbi:MAG: FAD-dependent oxidoreductase [Dehalococcoidales bacterium]|nr:FAD-dependent oxidoreductase [Dehalococcoidales bacterium]
MAEQNRFEKLLEPAYIGKVKTRNRMIKTAAYGWILYDMVKDAIRPEGVAYYEAIARGGIGLQILEISAPHSQTIGRPLYDDKYIERESKIVERMHRHGCPTFVQFYDFRPLMALPVTVSASAFCYPSRLDMNNALPRALSTQEVRDVIELVVNAAERARKAGYDGCELNCACSHLFPSFLSRFWNKRTDEYGPQNMENRARMIVELIQGIKRRCGADFPVSVLMNGLEINILELGDNAGCSTIEESAAFAKIFENNGADMLHVRIQPIGNHINGFFPEKFYMFGEPDTGFGRPFDIKKFIPEFVTEYEGAGGFIEIAAVIKKAVGIPVMTVGSMDPRLNPGMGENAIREGKIDFIGITRPLTADPDLPNKIAAGKPDEVRPCTYCITCFPQSRCRVNAASTRADGPEMPEGYYPQPAEKKKNVLVAGGGPSGLEAARVAALRGHRVTLYEKSSRLGGLMPLAAMVKGPHEKILDYVNYLSGQMVKLGVRVKLGQEVKVETVEKTRPDAVVVATGGAATVPDIPGIENPKVLSNARLHGTLETGLKFVPPFTLRALTRFYMPVGRKVVIIGGQIQGIQLAEFLVQRGRDVTVVDEGPEESLGLYVPGFILPRILLYNYSRGVKVLMKVKYHEITDQGLTVTTGYGIRKVLEADHIILALPLSPAAALADSLRGKAVEIYTVGDCKTPGVIVDAVESGHLVGRKI